MLKKRPSFFQILIIGFFAYVLWGALTNPLKNVKAVDYSTFIAQAEKKEFDTVLVDPGTRMLWGQDSQMDAATKKETVKTIAKAEYVGDGVVEILRTKGVNVQVRATGDSGFGFLIFPLLMLLIFFFVLPRLLRKMQGGLGQMMAITKSKMKSADGRTLTFKDVILPKGTFDEVSDIVRFLKDPDRFKARGAKMPKGVLFVGPPGCGKTVLARAVAGEAGVPFFHLSGSDFVEMFVGLGAARVRDTFEQLKRHKRAMLFIDEIDAIGRSRGAGIGNGNDEREQTLNALLVGMDGFEDNEGLIVIAATNRPDVLDPALVRPGRFNRQITIGRPNRSCRDRILRLYTQNMPMAADTDFDAIIDQSEGFSGADLENLANEAAIEAERADSPFVGTAQLDRALDKIVLGAETSLDLTDDMVRKICDHEAGHALVGLEHEKETGMRLIKMTAKPRSKALGFCMFAPGSDSTSHSEWQIRQIIMTALGGRCAEMTLHHMLWTGSQNDLERATDLAERMVKDFGMSSLGPVSYGGGQKMTFLGRDLAERQPYSEATAERIDQAKEELLHSLEKSTLTLLKRRETALRRLSAALFEKRTLLRSEINAVLAEVREAPSA